MQLKHRPLVFPLLVALALSVIGCGPGKSNVSGKVTLDGKDLHAGTIVFAPARGVAVSGEIKNGQYSVTGVPNGEAKVTLDNKVIAQMVEQAKQVGGHRSGPSTGASMQGPPSTAGMSPEAREGIEKQKKQSEEAARANKELMAKFRPIPEKYASASSSGLTFTVGSSSTFDIPLTSK